MRAVPAFGVEPLVNELLARTTNTNPYVYLTDGGHFENLGLYEMVLRRCRYIILSDAGCDGTYTFGDLANAVRRIRIDFGIDIEFPAGIHIGPSQTARVAVGIDPLLGDRPRPRERCARVPQADGDR